MVEFQPVSYNTDERMKVLKQEIENAKKYNQYLKKESESNSKKGESIVLININFSNIMMSLNRSPIKLLKLRRQFKIS